jgi:hypothetical protein
MGRPVEGRYIIVKTPCEKCGDNRQHKNRACVTCTREWNKRKYQKTRGAGVSANGRRIGATQNHHGHQRLTIKRISDMLADDARSVSAAARSRYLDHKTKQAFGLSSEDETKITCYGDVYRAQKQVGLPPRTTDYGEKVAENHRQNDALTDALKRTLKTLPDLIHVADVLNAVPPEIVEPITMARRQMAVALSLRAIGVLMIRRTSPIDGRRRLYCLRNADKYEQMTVPELVRAKRAMGRADSARRRTRAQRPLGARQEAMEQGDRRLTG